MKASRSSSVAASEAFAGFPAATFTFLRGLARHNDRAWFEAHRADYERHARAPMAALVEELDVRLAAVAPEMVGDPKRSVFRVHRDVRFAKDKSPYKTFLACWLFHRDQGRSAAMRAHGGSAGYYVHVEPGACFVAGGMWMPPAPTLRRIRQAIESEPDALDAIAGASAFAARYGALSDEGTLTRVPRGHAPDHPAAAWLRHRSFMARRALPDDLVRSPALPDALAEDLAALAPLVRWLNGALGYPPARRR